MAKYLQSSENIPITETGDNISFNLSNELLQKINNGGIEKGENENGAYIKFPDGTLICRKTVQGTVDVDTSTMGGAFYYGRVNLGNVPYNFIERPTYIVSPNTVSGTQYFLSGASGTAYGDATTFPTVTLLRPAIRTGLAYILDVVGIGRWK